MLLLRRRIQSEKTKKCQKRICGRKTFEEHKKKGEFHLLVQDMGVFDREYFLKYFQMTVTQYEELLLLIAPVNPFMHNVVKWPNIL